MVDCQIRQQDDDAKNRYGQRNQDDPKIDICPQLDDKDQFTDQLQNHSHGQISDRRFFLVQFAREHNDISERNQIERIDYQGKGFTQPVAGNGLSGLEQLNAQ